MARNDDYITNTSGKVSPFGIIINDMGFSLYPHRPVKGRFGPQEAGKESDGGRERPIILDDFSGGMAMAYRLIPGTYAFTINGYCRTPRMFTPAGLLTEIDLDDLSLTTDELALEARCAIEYFGDVYVGFGSYILKIESGTEAPEIEYFLGTDVQVDSALIYNAIPLFSTDNTYTDWRYLTGYDASSGTWKTAYDSAGPVPDAENPEPYASPVYLLKMVSTFEEIDGSGGNRLIGNDTPFTYTNIESADFDLIIGDTTAYAASLPCADSSYEIRQIVASGRVFYIIKVDGVYGIESSGIYNPNYTPDWKRQVNILNGASAAFMFGRIFVGSPRGVEMVDVSDRQRNDQALLISPSYKFANETPIFGLPTAMQPDDGWLSTFLYNGTDSHLCYVAPREASSQNPNPVIWHGSECTIEGQRVTMQFKTSVSGWPMMLIGTHDGTRARLYWLSLPKSNPIQDFLSGGDHQFSLTSKLYLPFQDWEDANAKKIVRRYDNQIDYLSVPIIDEFGETTGDEIRGQVDVYATADTGSRIFFETQDPNAANSEWSFQGSITASPRATMVPSSTATEGTQIGLLLSGELLNVGTDEVPVYKPFVVRSIKVRSEVIVEQLQEKTYPIVLGHYVSTQTGTRDFSTAQSKFAQLTALQNTGPVNMIDELHRRVVVKVEPGLQYEIIPERQSQEWTIVAEVVVSILGETFYWDLDHTYDTVYSWSS